MAHPQTNDYVRLMRKRSQDLVLLAGALKQTVTGPNDAKQFERGLWEIAVPSIGIQMDVLIERDPQ
jgi:hypothetical protein